MPIFAKNFESQHAQKSLVLLDPVHIAVLAVYIYKLYIVKYRYTAKTPPPNSDTIIKIPRFLGGVSKLLKKARAALRRGGPFSRVKKPPKTHIL
jgi:hypothetical protein